MIGLQLLPVFGVDDVDRAGPYASALGEAFQLTNFIRDVGEDLDRGRVYLPTDLWSRSVSTTICCAPVGVGVTSTPGCGVPSPTPWR